MSFNKIIIVGNLGRDPELRYTPNDKAVASFSMATNDRRKDGDDWVDVTTWFRVTLWGRLAELAAKHLEKGRQVYIEGRLRTEEWTDAEGNTRTSLEVTASEMQFIGGRALSDSDGDSDAATAETASADSADKPSSDDDIPF